MSRLFSARYKIVLFRKLWIALAKGQRQLGLPISEKQIVQMVAEVENIDFDATEKYEKKFRHDVMAHIHAFGDVCPEAKGIIHLGATSSYVTDNADLIQLKEGMALLFGKLLYVLERLAELAAKYANDPCLSYTHFQPAQPTTIGKRICLWLQDFLLDAKEWSRLEIPFLGAKGATGTQASFLALFDGDHKKVLELEKKTAAEFGFISILPIAGQTYTRKIDIQIANALESFAASAHKMATDIRLLAHEGEFCENFGETQVGSSAMPYKRNPIYSERICGIARFAISLAQNPTYTAATQWLERSLDDSSNRRLCIPELFLSVDAILNLLAHILSSPHIEPAIAFSHFERHLPELCMENLIMEGVKKGGDRQKLHEKYRTMSADDPELKTADPRKLIGRAPEQVADFLKMDVHPFLRKHPVGKVSIPPVER